MKGKKNLTFKQFMGKESVAGVVFCSPFIIGFLMFMIVPMGISLYYSFCDYRLLPCSLLSSINHRRLCSSSRSVEEDLGDQRCDQYPVKHHWH